MIGKGSSTSLERTSGSDRSEKTGNESSTGDTLPAVTGRPNAYDTGTALKLHQPIDNNEFSKPCPFQLPVSFCIA